MEAKDTVMMPKQTMAKRKELFPHGHKDCFECEQFVREQQAEISFKAGEEQEYKRWIKFALMAGIMLSQPQQLKRIIPSIKADEHKAGIITGTVEGKYDGRREVVEWIEHNKSVTMTDDSFIELGVYPKLDWQAKLKEWGIDK